MKGRSSSRFGHLRLHGVLALKSSFSNQSSSRSKNGEYTPISIIGKGAFGVVYIAKAPNGEKVAIKKVLQDPRFKNREVDIVSILHHPNCVDIKGQYQTKGKNSTDVFLHIIMEYMPQSLADFTNHYTQQRLYPPLLFVKLFAFQMFAGLNYIHGLGIIHRDIKPQNLLCNPETGVLKLCDFGSAKAIKPGDKSVSYIASRYYRAPELILDCQEYSSSIDIWAAGCVIVETLNSGRPLFIAETSFDMIKSMVKVLGRPTEEDLNSFPHSLEVPPELVQKVTLQKVVPSHCPPDLLDLLQSIFQYNPSQRPSALKCMQHPCFDDLFRAGLTLPSKKPFPPLDRDPSPPPPPIRNKKSTGRSNKTSFM